MVENPLEGKVALITGAGSPKGMGQAIAIRLAEEGADIVVSDIEIGDPDPSHKNFGYEYGAFKGLDAAVSKIEALGRKALAITADVRKSEDVQALVKSVRKDFKRLDILVNVAGGDWGAALIKDYDESEFIKTFDINMFGTFRMCKYALPYIARKKGTIINMSSMAATRTNLFYSAYAASKAAIISFTESLALEYGPKGVNAFALLPGMIQTEMLDYEARATAGALNLSEDDVKKLYIDNTPLRCLGKPIDVGNLVAFLCSDRASFLTGLAISVSGGLNIAYPISEIKF